MKHIQSMYDLAIDLTSEGGYTHMEFPTNRAVIDVLIEMGSCPEVYASYDEYHSLKDLSEDFLNAAPDDENIADVFETECADVLEKANNIIPLANAHLSEEDIEHVREDILYGGGDPDAYPHLSNSH